jgi:hypothetical protein
MREVALLLWALELMRKVENSFKNMVVALKFKEECFVMSEFSDRNTREEREKDRKLERLCTLHVCGCSC